MIQRIQSIYLFIMSACFGSSIAFPFATSETGVANTFFADKIFNTNDNIIMLSILALVAVIALISIFLYSNRKLQKSITTLGVWLGVLTIGYIGYLLFQQSSMINLDSITPSYSSVLVLAGPIFGILASRAIQRDENLVRSADRLR